MTAGPIGALPDSFADEDALEEFMTRPTDILVEEMAAIEGDLIVLGVGGKMGPTLARMAKRASPDRRVIGVARFSDPEVAEKLESWGIETISCDLLDRAAVEDLPKAPNVVFMAGRKFGTSGNLPLTWAMNVAVPATVAEVYRDSRIVAFSTGNVYAQTPVVHAGAVESDIPKPIGEYAQSCLGRERIFEHYSNVYGTPGRLIRLNYAIDMRYGVLEDIGRKVFQGEPVDVTTGNVNFIWQGDANAQILRALGHCTAPASPLNISGPEAASVRAIAHAFAERFDKPAQIVGEEAENVWLINTAEAARLFGYPTVPLLKMVDWVADWLQRSGRSYNKPTAFDAADGKF